MGLLSAAPRLDSNRSLDFVTENRLLQIDVRFSDISEWFLRPERVEGTVGEQLTWTRRSEHFSAEIIEGARRFTLSSKGVGSRCSITKILPDSIEPRMSIPANDSRLYFVPSSLWM
jgi:hypothetical protein